MERIKISDIKPGKMYELPVLLQSMEDCTTQSGSTYVKATITDGTVSVAANKFSCNTEKFAKAGVEPEKLVKIVLENKNGFYNFMDIEPCTDPTVDIKDFVKTSPINIDKGFDYIVKAVQDSAVPLPDGSNRYAEVTEYILNKYKDEIKHCAAAKSMHHNYPGGLVHHTATMIALAKNICKVYPDLDKELLICGCALHDIGKIVELTTSAIGTADYTIEGVLLGHLWIGSNIIERTYCEDFKHPIDENVVMLLHLVASHHGIPEYGAITRPAFKEAYVLHSIDMLDSRMQMYNNEYETIEPGNLGEKRSFGLDTRVYHPVRI